MLYIGETGRRLGNRFCDHLRDVQKKKKKKPADAFKPVSKHSHLPGHSSRNMNVYGTSLYQGKEIYLSTRYLDNR